jgi:hypothetical protein
MTAAAALFAISAFLTILVASNYRFFIACVWVILGILFVGFVWFVQQTVLCTSQPGARRRAFHPAVHAVADWVIREVKDIAADCRNEYLQLIANKPAHESGYVAEPTMPETQRTHPRSKLFRNIVKPLIKLTFGGRRKRRKEKKKQKSTEESKSYVPPTTTTAGHDRDIV